jgi:tripartite-type tricarboxylate transporter receptor subunit TctC
MRTLLVLALLTGAAQGEPYPSRPVTIVVASSAGGGPDVIARVVADRLSQSWGQPVMIVNHAGGGGLVAAQAARGLKPDGYGLYLPVASNFTILAQTHEKLPLDFQRDIRPIGLIGEQPFVIAVASSVGINSLAELIAAAGRRPGELTYGAVRAGLPHMAMEMLRANAGFDLTFVPYTALRQAVPDVMSGRISIVVDSISALSGAFERGSIKPLAVASRDRLPDFPQLPTVAETVAGYEARGWFALMAPAATPDEIVQKVSRDLRTALEHPDVSQKFRSLGTYPRFMSPDDLAGFIRREQELWKPVIQQLGPLPQ